MSMRPRNVALGWLAFSAVAGFVFAGSALYRAAIGLDPSAFPLGPQLRRVAQALGIEVQVALAGLMLALVLVLALALAGFFLMAHAVRSKAARTDPGRRSFLTGAASGAALAIGAAALGLGGALARAFAGLGNGGRGWGEVGREIFAPAARTHPEWKAEWKGSRVRSHRRLGRTGFQVSDIVLGSGRIRGAQGTEIVKAALDRGVNYIDTAPDYSATGSEEAIGRALRGRRDEVFLATKLCTSVGHLPPGTPVARYKEAVEGSLRRLGTDYVDLVHIHSCDEIDRLMDPNAHEAFDCLRDEGKVRFLGVSTHTPNLAQVATRAIESGRFDVMMLAYHHGIWPQLGDLIERARRERDMGIVAMKTLKGAKHHGLEGFRERAGAFSQAALKWTLSNPNVSCAVISFFELQHVDEYLYASGKAPGRGDRALLEEYDRRVAGRYCMPHCGACLDRCPAGLPIHEVLRHRMYFEDYGWEEDAVQLYGKLERNASICASCSAPCAGACPAGVPIQERMAGAHALLALG